MGLDINDVESNKTMSFPTRHLVGLLWVPSFTWCGSNTTGDQVLGMRSGKSGLLLFMRPFQGVRDLILGLIFFLIKKSRTGSDFGFDVVVASWEHLLWACIEKYGFGHAFVSNPILESDLGLI